MTNFWNTLVCLWHCASQAAKKQGPGTIRKRNRRSDRQGHRVRGEKRIQRLWRTWRSVFSSGNRRRRIKIGIGNGRGWAGVRFIRTTVSGAAARASGVAGWVPGVLRLIAVNQGDSLRFLFENAVHKAVSKWAKTNRVSKCCCLRCCGCCCFYWLWCCFHSRRLIVAHLNSHRGARVHVVMFSKTSTKETNMCEEGVQIHRYVSVSKTFPETSRPRTLAASSSKSKLVLI